MVEDDALQTWLFIYLVRGRDGDTRYMTLVASGSTRSRAEAVAINRVHQQRARIVRTDTATRADWLDPSLDAGYLDELRRFGVALAEMAA